MNNQEQAKYLAQTIYSQIGGLQRLAVMTGAKDFKYNETGISFSLPKAKNAIRCVEIRLEPNDTYTMTFWKRGKVAKVQEIDDVYCDQLIDTFEIITGLYLTF